MTPRPRSFRPALALLALAVALAPAGLVRAQPIVGCSNLTSGPSCACGDGQVNVYCGTTTPDGESTVCPAAAGGACPTSDVLVVVDGTAGCVDLIEFPCFCPPNDVRLLCVDGFEDCVAWAANVCVGVPP